jgi:hypothetical protein
MLTHPKATGDRSTLAVMVALYENEIPFLLPLGENMRYDPGSRVRNVLLRDRDGERHV